MSEIRQFDVFVTYHNTDKALSRQLALVLKSRGLSVWFDEWELRPGESLHATFERIVQTIKSIAVLVGSEGLAAPWQMPEDEVCIPALVSRGTPVILVLLPGALCPPQGLLPSFLTQRPWVDLRKGLSPTSINGLQWSITGSDPATHIELHRVCFISSEYPPHLTGGLGVHVKELTKALALTGLAVDVLLPDARPPYEPCTMGVHCIAMAGVHPSYSDPVSWLFFAAAAVNNLAAMDPRPQVVHCHDWMTVLAGIKARWVFGIPLVYHLHMPNEDPMCRTMENLGLVCADLVTVSSDALLTELQARNMPVRSVRLLENGVDIGLFKPHDDRPANEESERYILFVGRLVAQKGLEYLLRAFGAISEQFPEVHLRIVGEDAGSPLPDWLKTLSLDLGISDRVHFSGWVGHGPELAKLYQGADLVVMPSLCEAFGIVALEAMACKCPVVASRVGGLRMVVGAGPERGGVLVEPKSVLDLVQSLTTLLGRRELRDKLAQQAYTRVTTGPYLWPKIAEKTRALYGDVLRGPVRDTEVRKETMVQIVRQLGDEAARRGLSQNQLLNDLFDWMARL